MKNNREQRVDRVVEDGSFGSSEIRELLEDPPDWLSTQLARCRENADIIKPTCCTVAYQVFGTATRWEEVRPAVEAALEGGGHAG